MGYSHHFPHRRDITREEWEAIRRDFKALVHNLPSRTDTAGGFYIKAPLKVAFDRDEPDAGLLVSDNQIRFNGVGSSRGGAELDHDNMLLCRRQATGMANFCNTARKPYDLLVCALLIVAAHHAPGALNLRTDGGPEDWGPAADFVRETLGLEAWPDDLEEAGIRASELTRPAGLGEDELSPGQRLDPALAENLARLTW